MEMAAEKRELHYDLLRILSVIAFVVTLVAFRGIKMENLDNSRAMAAYLSVCSFGVPMFVLLSGSHLCDPEQPFVIGTYLKRFLRLLIAFLFWSGLYAVINFAVLGFPETATAAEAIKEFIKYAWFHRLPITLLLTMMGLYLAAPILRQIAANRNITVFYLFLAAMFACVFPTLQSNPTLYKTSYILNYVDLPMCLGYSGLFLAGYFLRTHRPGKRLRISLYVLGLLSVGAMYLFFRTTKLGTEDIPSYNYNFVPQVLILLAIFVAFTELGRKLRLNERQARWITVLSDATFGVYLCSLMIVVLLGRIGMLLAAFLPSANAEWGLHGAAFAPIFAIPVTALAALLIAFPLSVFLRKIPVLGKYLV